MDAGDSNAKIKIHPNPMAFFLKHYGYAVLVAILLLPAGFFVLTETRTIEYALGVWAIAVILLATALIHTHLHQRTYIALTEEELVYESGIFNHNHVTVPLNKITDTAIYQSWFDKLLGVATLRANTAGGAGYEVIALDFPMDSIKLIHIELNKLLRAMPDSLPDNLAKK